MEELKENAGGNALYTHRFLLGDAMSEVPAGSDEEASGRFRDWGRISALLVTDAAGEQCHTIAQDRLWRFPRFSYVIRFPNLPEPPCQAEA